MIRIFLLTALSFLIIQAKAQTVTDIFINMPDSIIPYLSNKQRQEIIELKKMEPDSVATINSSFGKIMLRRLSDSILTLELSEHNSLELGKLDSDKYVFIKTYGAPLQESSCYIIDNTWKEIKVVDFSDIDFTQVSDSIPEQEKKEMLNSIEFPLVSASIGATSKELILKFNTPLMTTEEKKRLDALTSQRNVKWNGETFN